MFPEKLKLRRALLKKAPSLLGTYLRRGEIEMVLDHLPASCVCSWGGGWNRRHCFVHDGCGGQSKEVTSVDRFHRRADRA